LTGDWNGWKRRSQFDDLKDRHPGKGDGAVTQGSDPIHSDWQRRDFLAGMALLGAAFAAHAAPASARPIAPYQALMRDVAQIMIPHDHAGGGRGGVGAFVLLALAHGLQGTHKVQPESTLQNGQGHFDYAAWLAADLDRRVGAPHLAAPLARRQAALAALDADAFGGVAAAQPWHKLKALILTGYYTSEVGGSQELAYEHIPGRFDPDLPVTAQTRAYSSDWTAVDFG
jgi:hypothetical protein